MGAGGFEPPPSSVSRNERQAIYQHKRGLTCGVVFVVVRYLLVVALRFAEAIRLTRVLRELMPEEPEVEGLLALMLLTESRRPGRTTPDGDLVLLADQDRSRWDGALIAEGQAIVRECLRRNRPGPYQVQAAINAVHSDARSAANTDWRQVVQLYEQLLALSPTRSSRSTGRSRWPRSTVPLRRWSLSTPSTWATTTSSMRSGRTC